MEMDASDIAVRVVLLQAYMPGGTLFPCTYYLGKHNLAERNYIIWEKELLAIKVVFEVWSHHLEGVQHQIEVWMDHNNLKCLQTTQKSNQQQIRWSLFFHKVQFLHHVHSKQSQPKSGCSLEETRILPHRRQAPALDDSAHRVLLCGLGVSGFTGSDMGGTMA